MNTASAAQAAQNSGPLLSGESKGRPSGKASHSQTSAQVCASAGYWAARMGLALLLLALFAALTPAQVRVAENSGKRKLDEALIAETYKQVARQMDLRGHPLKQKPEIALHVVSTQEAARRLEECTQGGCGHVLRLGVSLDQQARIVFVSLSSEGAKLWMDEPDGYMLAKAVTVALDYENRLYLAPDEIHEIADTAGRAAVAERRGKISVEALRASK